ncbi:helix-turn-helix domain-containing protein [Sphingomonas sp. RIT328]|uniref:helix-turn-helix domain-containing protein n=1 Tax=Sphingomonas sp. RIT328 TaxID=1470591 RepID=UPI0005648665
MVLRSGRELVRLVEMRRRKLGLTQMQVSRACGISQGHYSKLLNEEVPVGVRCATALATWLDDRHARVAASRPVRDARVARLLEAIAGDISRLTSLLTEPDGGDGREGRGRS